MKEILYKFDRGLRIFLSRQTLRKRDLGKKYLYCLRPIEYLTRKSFVNESSDKLLSDLSRDGISRNIEGMFKTQRLVEEANDLFDRIMNLDQEISNLGEKPFLFKSLRNEELHGSEIIKFASSKKLLQTLTNYFGMAPIIEDIALWYSPNNRDIKGSSQLFHLDGQDVKTIQIFVYLDEVGAENGPLLAITAPESKKICKAVNYRKAPGVGRLSDTVISNFSPQVTMLTGKLGAAFVADTDRCLHAGSRKANKPRKIMVFQYITPFAFTLPHKYEKAAPFARYARRDGFDSLQKLVLGCSSRDI